MRWASLIVMAMIALPARAEMTDETVTRITYQVLDALNKGEAARVYDAMTPGLQAQIGREAFVSGRADMIARIGQATRAGIARVTWYDDTEGAGRLAAVDFGLRHSSDHLTCGYILWSVAADGAASISRIDTTVLLPDLVTGPRPAFDEAFQKTPCHAIPGDLLGPAS